MSKYYVEYTVDCSDGTTEECVEYFECSHDEMLQCVDNLRKNECYNIQVTEEE